MAREKYTILPAELPVVVRYLTRKCREGYWLTKDVSAEFQAAEEYETAKRDVVTLNAWCERWLTDSQWTQLKNAVRAARKRARDLTRDKPVSVTLSRRAWRILHDLAERDGATLSELIEQKLGREWLQT